MAGEVIFPDADSVTVGRVGARSAPGSAPAGDTPPELLFAGARAHNRWLAELCARQPRAAGRRGDRADHGRRRRGRRRDPPGSRSGLRGGILIPPMWQPHAPYHDRRYDPVWAVCEELAMPVHVHSGVGRPGLLRPPHRHLHHRGALLVVAAALVPDLVGCVRALPRPEVRCHRVRRVLGQRPALADGPGVRARPRLAEARATSSPPR